jgi:hypothetical protein
MPKVLLVAQDKGGSGKSLIVRGLAECLPTAPLIEIEASHRLVELDERLDFYPVRADRSEIDRTGGAAARAEFDGVLNRIAAAKEPTIVDVGANTSSALLPLLAAANDRFAKRSVKFAVLAIATAEPGAIANVPDLLALARRFASALFVVENRVENVVDPKLLKALGEDVVVSVLEKLALDEHANGLLQKGGLAFIADELAQAEDNLVERFGFAEAGRIVADLTAFRAAVMAAAAPAARWLEG